MNEELHQIDNYLVEGEVKKADILVAKLLRHRQSSQDYARIIFRRARTRFLSARPDDAIDDLLALKEQLYEAVSVPTFLELLADCYFARFELASVGFTDRNDTLLAQRIYEQIKQEYPEYLNLGWVNYQLARIFVTLGKVEEAIDSFEQALLRPSQVSGLTAYCYERLGFLAFYDQRNLDQALVYLNRAIDTYPTGNKRDWLAQVHILRSRVLKNMSDYDGALLAAEASISILANLGDKKLVLSEALLATAELLVEMKGHDRSIISTLHQFIQITKKPLGIDVTWSRVNEMLGDAYFNIGQYDNAVTAYKAALQFNPDHPWELSLYYRIARSYYQQRTYGEALDAIDDMLKIAQADGQSINDYRVYDIRGSAFFALGHYDKAIEAYQTALQMAPPNANNLSKIKSYYDLALERR